MHGFRECYKKETAIVCIAGWYVSRCFCRCALHFAVPASHIFLFSPLCCSFFLLYFSPSFVFSYSISSRYSQILILSSFLLWFFQTVGGSIKFSSFMLAAGGSLGTKIDCPFPATWEIVNTLKPAAFRCYCTYSSTVREGAYTKGAFPHVQFLSCLALCPHLPNDCSVAQQRYFRDSW